MCDDPLGFWPEFRAALIEARGRRGAAQFLDFAAQVLWKEARIHEQSVAQRSEARNDSFQLEERI